MSNREVTHARRLEGELSRYQERLRTAFGIGVGDHVLDIGCGSGETTREAAGIAVDGSAHGVDLTASVIATARELAAGLDNVTFEHADVQVHPFPPERFDLAISRFGTMFFPDPVAAFTNIARALRPGARLTQLVWQNGDRQEWWPAIAEALTGDPTPPPAGPFALGDPVVTEGILTAAGFTGVEFEELREPVHYGPLAEAYDFVTGWALTMAKVTDVDEAALDRLRAVLAAHDTGDGVWFDSRAWLVTAHRK
jgi:SAM-dependent methyltransferase